MESLPPSLRTLLIIGILASIALGAFFLMDPRDFSSVMQPSGRDGADGVSQLPTGTVNEISAQEDSAHAMQDSILECQLERSLDGDSAEVSAKLVEKDTGEGISGRHLLLVALPGNPVAESLTDQTGEAKVSVDLSAFDTRPSSMFMFFDGDDKYSFSSCEIKAANS